MDFTLSKRELEIVELLEKGLTTKEIAADLFLSHHTVDTHRRNILRKTTVKNTAQLIYQLRIEKRAAA